MSFEDENIYQNMHPRSFGHSVRFHRLNQGIGSIEFADLAGISYSQLSKIEQHNHLPGNRTVSKIAVALNRLSLIDIAAADRTDRMTALATGKNVLDSKSE